MSKIIDKSIPKFLFVGILNTLVGAGIMFLLYNFFGCSYWISTAFNYIIGGIMSFFLNKYFTFENHKWSWNQAFRFALVVAGCWLIAYGITKPIVFRLLAQSSKKIQGNIAMLAGMGLYTILSYFGQRFFAFKAQ